MKLITVFACQRSGQHGIINWICKQHNNITHLNDVVRSPDGRSFIPVNGRAPVVYGTGADVLVNMENFWLERWSREWWPELPCVQAAHQMQHVLVIRRFRNWLASVAAHPGNPDLGASKWYLLVGTYADHLNVALGLTSPMPIPGLIIVRFDDWFASIDYRRNIANQLQLPFTDDGLNNVARYGGGSSFDQYAYNGKAQEMNVLERWKQMEGNPLYDIPFKRYAELDAMSEKLFNIRPASA